MKKVITIALLGALVLSLGVCGCKKSDDGGTSKAPAAKIDLSKPIADLKAEVGAMSVDQLTDTAMKYKKAIEAKKPELDALAAKLKEIPLTNMLGEEAKGLKTEIEEITKSISELQKRFDVYYKKLVELKADVSGLKM